MSREAPGRIVSLARSAAVLLGGLLAALVAAATPFRPARAEDERVGPPIGNVRYEGDISEAGDEDDFTGRFVAGDVFSMTLAVKKPSRKEPATLVPLVVMIDPDGATRSAGIFHAPNGQTVTLRTFKVDKAGLWTVRVTGKDDTAGPYTVAFKAKPGAKTVLKKQSLGGNVAPFRDHQFGACEGAVLSATIAWTKSSNPLVLESLTGPSGGEVTDEGGDPVVDAAVKRGNRITLSHVLLSAPGRHELHVRMPAGISGFALYDLTLELRSPAKPTSKKPQRLLPAEPFLDPVAIPFAGEPGDTLTFTGRNFSTKPLPKVRFGNGEGEVKSVSEDGTSLQVVVPPRADAAVVGVSVVNPDAQAARQPLYFAYVPPPIVTDLVDAATGAQVRSAPATGGKLVRLFGANFEAGYTVKVGPATVGAVTFVSSAELRFALPAVAQGNHEVTVTDPFTRVGRTPFTVFLKTPPAFAATPYTPGAVRIATPTTITVHGTGFDATDVLFVANQQVASTFVDSATRTFNLPAMSATSLAIRLVDSVGSAVNGPDLVVKGPPVITQVSVVAGDVLGTIEIPVGGGSTIQVDGSDFLSNDVVTLGGTQITTYVDRTATRKRFKAPAHAAGLVGITVTDGAGQQASASSILRYVGFADTSSSRVPALSASDDLSAVRGAAGDLDRDGKADDVVLVSRLNHSPGTRSGLTRILRGDSAGALQDVTGTSMPSASSPETFDANCLAIGDVDGANGADLVLGGAVISSDSTYQQVRLLTNGGSGSFTLDLTNSPPARYQTYVLGTYYYGYYTYTIYGTQTQKGQPQALALGDVDGDGDRDLVVGTDHYLSRQVYIDPNYVNFYYSPPAISFPQQVNYAQYFSATRLYENRIGASEGMVDVTATNLPAVGNSRNGTVTAPAFHCRDLALVDIDRDVNRRLDLVVAWSNPQTVSPVGLKGEESTGTPGDSARVATRVFLNAGGGNFSTDRTSTWLPSASSPEFWHADRIAVADLNGDQLPELVLLTKRGLDAWTGTETRNRSALRVLRNDGSRFTDVTSTAIPAVDRTLADDWRGDALAVHDVNADGFPDILVSTHESFTDGDGNAVPRLRVFYGGSGLVFKVSRGFQEPASVDTGDADDLVVVGDLGTSPVPVYLLLTESAPGTSPAARPKLRSQEWKR